MPERVGIIFVHGIGEQKRFEHLDGQTRDFVSAIVDATVGGTNFVTVELRDALSAAFLGTENTWLADRNSAAARAVIRDGSGNETHLFMHEVWWADVNEPYSLRKQIRFWFWAASIWLLPPKETSKRAGFRREMQTPPPAHDRAWLRVRLFCVSWIFAAAALSWGLGLILLKRVLDIDPPNFIKILVNYVSAVKLYNQRSRAGGDFLDALDEPPRVSVRRRMMRALADVALARYDRWYIVAHSQGTVIAFNGLSESGHVWPNYLDQDRWRRIRSAGFGGAARSAGEIGDTADMEPVRPLWLDFDEIVYREKIFERFTGFVTLGSPLNKFAAIWPARVPNNRFPAFRPETWWINFFDPLDPVSGVLQGFELRTLAATPPTGLDQAVHGSPIKPQNYGCRTSPLLLAGHTRYLEFSVRGVKHGVAIWLAQTMGLIAPPAVIPPGNCYGAKTGVYAARRAISHAEWLILFLIAAGSSSLVTWLLFGAKLLKRLGPT